MNEYLLNSANIIKITWSNKELDIYFTSGEVNKYLDVPEGIAVGITTAPSAGSYIRFYVSNQYLCRKIKEADINEKIKKLQHHMDSTVGLWATDKPEFIPKDHEDMFFQITEC